MSTLVIAEHDNTNLKPATLNTVAAASVIGGAVHILVAGSSCQSVADEAAAVEDRFQCGKLAAQAAHP